MAVTVKKGEIYPAKEMKSGVGKRGEWALLSVKAEKGYDKIDIWATNPADVKGAGAVKIVDFEAASITNQKKETPEGIKWYIHYSVNAKLEPVTGRSEDGEWVTPDDDLADIFNL